MNKLFAGFARVNVTPVMGTGMPGYFNPRFAEGVLDELEINALALSCGETKAVLLSMDNEGNKREIVAEFRKYISELTDIPEACIFIHATHTHTGGNLVKDSTNKFDREYYQDVYYKMADAARLAVQDLKPARMGYGTGTAPNIAFLRRFRMKDGSIQTNPGVDNPDILEPMGQVDEQVGVLRIDREDAETIVLVSFACHPDTVGGCKISADWPGFLRRTIEKTLEKTKCIFFNGAEGDVNHVNVHPAGGDLNDMFMDFDDVSRGYGHARYMGRVVAGGVLQVYDKVKYTEADQIRCLQRTVSVPSNMPKPEELPEARRIDALHRAGRDEEIPFSGMMLTTVVAEADRMLRLEHGPKNFEMELSGIAIGDAVLVGIPGEPFNGIGRELKKAKGWGIVMPTCLTNGHQGYFPMMDAYREGGYEARSSNFRAGAAELLIREGLELLRDIKNKKA